MSKKLRIERVIQCLSQEELSDMCGVSRATIQRIESKGIDGIKVGSLKKIAKTLNKSVQELFFD